MAILRIWLLPEEAQELEEVARAHCRTVSLQALSFIREGLARERRKKETEAPQGREACDEQ